MASVSGTVIRGVSTERVANGVVKATSASGQIVQVPTDDDGDFTFSNLQVGQWSFIALHEKNFPNSPLNLMVSADMANVLITVTPMEGEYDESKGTRFVKGLMIGLGVLIFIYIVLHIAIPVKLTNTSETFFWDNGAWRYFEIMLWALAGVLVNKIISCGWYLRRRAFYREGIIMHVSHLVTTPLMVFVAILILSLVKITLTLGGNTDITLDLSRLPILIAVSFILGTCPWPIWDFIEKSAKKIIGEGKKEPK